MKKIDVIRRSGQNTLVAIAILGVSTYLGFTPLFELVGAGVAANVVGASFGAIFVIVLTMYLLNKQTEIEQENKKSEKIFEEKVTMYKKMLQATRSIVADGKLSSLETNELSFLMTELQMLGTNEAIDTFNLVLSEIIEIFQSTDQDPVLITDDDKMQICQKLSKFSLICRTDLGIEEVSINDEEMFNATNDLISAAVKGKKDLSKYEFEGEKYGKGRLAHAVVKYWVDKHPGITLNEMLEVFTPGKTGIMGKANINIVSDLSTVEGTNYERRYFTKDEDIMTIADCKIVVSNQWGIRNIGNLLDLCKKLNIKIN